MSEKMEGYIAKYGFNCLEKNMTRSDAPDQYNPDQFFSVGDGFGLFVFIGKHAEIYFRTDVVKRTESRPGSQGKRSRFR